MSWERIEPKRSSPAPRHCHCSVSFGGKVYIFGGTNGKDRYNDLYAFDPTRSSWSKVKTTGHAPSARYCAAMGVYKESLIVFGGYDGSRNNSIYSLSMATLTWSLIIPAVGSAMPMPRSHHCLAIVDHYMYIFGGLSEEAKLLCDLYVFNLQTLMWKALNPEGNAPCGRINHSAHILGNFLVVFGGYDGKLRLNDMILLNLDTMTWVTPLVHGVPPSRRLGHASTVAGDKLIIIGGDDGNKERELLNDLHIFDLDTMKWHQPEVGGSGAPGAGIPQGRTHATACVITEEPIISSSSKSQEPLSTCTIHVWLIDGSNSQKTKLDEIFRLDLSSLYIFQKMWIDRASHRILQQLNDAHHQLQLRGSLSSHLASKRSSPPASRKTRPIPPSSSAIPPVSPDSLSSSSQTAPISTNQPLSPNSTAAAALTSSASAISPSSFTGPSLLELEEHAILTNGYNDGQSQPKKAKQRRGDRNEPKERALAPSASSGNLPSSSEPSTTGEDRNARSPKKSRRAKPEGRRDSSRRETSPTPHPISPYELSPATSPRSELGLWAPNEEDEPFDGSSHIATFGEAKVFSTDDSEDEPEAAIVQRVRRVLSAIQQSFHRVALEKESFQHARQERLALIEEAGTRDSFQAQEMNRLVQTQKSRVTLNVGGQLYTTSIPTLTRYPDSMLATMFSGRHPLVPEADGTYFIDRDGTYFRYILNYLRCGNDAVLEAKPSVLAELLAEARFYQLEGLKDAINVILSDPDLTDEAIVEY